MSIRLHNSMTRKLEEFKPLQKDKVGMYACGITPYDEVHIGHAMQAVIFDNIRNYLEYAGYDVTYVRNYTDVDDKIIHRANEEGVDPLTLSSRYITETQNDFAALMIKPATHEPKVSDYISEIITFIEELIKKENAYVSNGDVLFSVRSFDGYGKLSNRKLDDLENKDISDHKRDAKDFALWKTAKDEEPFWESPWGNGRPGWHIECSAMARDILGDTFDIHGGGLDLIFPHHENEIAQSECLTHKPMANYWIHNGLVMVGKQKMSKSLGNFYTVKQALEKYTADEIRFLILSNHYSSNIDFSEDAFRVARKRVYYFYRTFEKINSLFAEQNIDAISAGHEKSDLMKEFEQSMDENFNTSKVIAAVSSAFTQANTLLGGKKKQLLSRIEEVQLFVSDIRRIGEVIGFLINNPSEYLQQAKNSFLSELDISESYIQGQIEERKQAKIEKDFEKADLVRETLEKLGIQLQDTPAGTIWDIDLKEN